MSSHTRYILLASFILCQLAGCHTPETSPRSTEASLTVFAAASLADAFTEIAQDFERKTPGVRVRLNLAGSQQLARQIIQGAPSDVFASANQFQMQKAIESGRIEQKSTKPFVKNHLVVIGPKSHTQAVHTLADLTQPGLSIILADEAVPAGAYSRVFLENASRSIDPTFASQVLANVVSFELNVRSVLTKVALGEADAGIVYLSDLIDANNLDILPIPDSLNVEAYYPIAPLKDSTQPVLANSFIAFVHSQDGQDILASYGFDTRIHPHQPTSIPE